MSKECIKNIKAGDRVHFRYVENPELTNSGLIIGIYGEIPCLRYLIALDGYCFQKTKYQWSDTLIRATLRYSSHYTENSFLKDWLEYTNIRCIGFDVRIRSTSIFKIIKNQKLD